MFRVKSIDEIINEVSAKIDEAGSLEKYHTMCKEERLNSAVVIPVDEFKFEFPHNVPYFTISTQNGTQFEFGRFGSVETLCTESKYIVATAYNRPACINHAVKPDTYRFEFNSIEKMTCFINKVVASKQVYYY